jgi:threonine/homoserine/homoserine lactone efflux protein
VTAASILTLAGAMLAIAIVPGPSDFLVVARSITAGFAHGAAVTLGVIAADYVFILAAIFSLGLIASQFAELFAVIKYVCGFYLIALGVAMLCTRNEQQVESGLQTGSWVASLSSGFLVTLGDPKAIFFYLGFLLAFVDMANATGRDAVIVMAVATVTIAVVKLSYAYLSGRAKKMLETDRARTVMQTVGSGVLVATGAFVLVDA